MIPGDTDPKFLNIIKKFFWILQLSVTSRCRCIDVRVHTVSFFSRNDHPTERRVQEPEFQCAKMKTLCLACIKGTVSQSDESKLTPRLSFRRFT